VIDDHCHPFSLAGGRLELAELSLDIDAAEAAQQERARVGWSRVSQELLRVRLARRLGCAPSEVEEARARAQADWSTYVAGLFRDAGLSDLVMDAAYPPGASERLADYEAVTGCRVHALLRIEPIIDVAMGEGASTTEIRDLLARRMVEAVNRGCVGFKTVIAYRTGLAVDPDVGVEAADRSLRSEAPVRRRGKACRDYLLRWVLGTAAELGRAVQIHTGFGDSEIRLAEANPLLLEELLRTPEGSAARVVLLHASYPWHEQLGYLSATRANVWADFSLVNLYGPATTADRLFRLLDLAPATKVLAATDGYGEPETFWFAASVLRDAWAAVAARLLAVGARVSWIQAVEQLIFEENARTLYGIRAESDKQRLEEPSSTQSNPIPL
jgi:predicted TIM-barrel fold metal-dependent hydrolase